MSEMNFLEKLLDGVNVEWRPLSEALNRTKGTKITAAQMRELHKEGAPIKIFAGGKTYAFFDFSDIPKKDINEEPSIIVKSRGFIEFEYYDKPFSHKNEMWSYNANGKQLDIKFVYYFLKVHEPYFQNIGSKMQMPQISIPDTDNFRIPIPCPENPKKSLEIQAEIVRILDAMTAHTAELTAELTARKKQYNYYRDKLLSFEDGEVEVEWKKLGDILKTIKTGKLNANAMVDNGRYPFFTCDSKPFKIDTYAFDTEAIIVSGNGSQVGHINYYKGKFNAYQRTYILADCIKEMKIEFLLIYLKAYLRAYIMRHSKKGSVPYITMPMLENFLAPVPSIEKQIQIFSALSKFEILTESMIQGLPKEIELREKQYSYYRELLLNFKNPKEQPLWN